MKKISLLLLLTAFSSASLLSSHPANNTIIEHNLQKPAVKNGAEAMIIDITLGSIIIAAAFYTLVDAFKPSSGFLPKFRAILLVPFAVHTGVEFIFDGVERIGLKPHR
jgi:hypothetical protein